MKIRAKRLVKPTINMIISIMIIMGISIFGNCAYAAKQISIFIDGEELFMDVAPIIMEDRTMVPLRAVSEAVGCKVDWFAENRRIVVYSPAGDDPILVMNIDNRDVTVNYYNDNTSEITGKVVTIEAPPVIVNGRTMVPLRFIAETIGFEVEWDGNSRTVFLISAIYEGDYGDN